jgi:hypothetical protein
MSKQQEEAAKEPEPAAKEPEPTDEQLPPPNLTYLAGTLYLQGAIAMGILANPMTKKSELNLAQAKHAIDTLEMLQEKTEGNRAVDESEAIEGMLHQLRMAYVEVKTHQGA